MDNNKSFVEMSEKYFNLVRNLRDVHSQDKGYLKTEASSINSALLDFSNDRFKSYEWLLHETEKIAYKFMAEAIEVLFSTSSDVRVEILQNTPILAIVVLGKESKTLYYFKKYGFPSEYDQIIVKSLCVKNQISSYKLVSLVKSNAATYSFDHKFDGIDISISEFLKLYFTNECIDNFFNLIEEFTDRAKKYIGHSVIKILEPNSLFYFKRFIKSFLRSSQYRNVIDESNREGGLDESTIEIIEEQFFSNEYYKAIIGESLFAESLITAEWMYDSISHANNLDLTIVALGYFKALEQFLFEYIKLHKGEDRKIKRIYIPALQGKPDKIYLNDSSIRKCWINTMMDSLVTFIEDYPDLFISGIPDKSREYVLSKLIEVKKLRNGYFHKDNISDREIVDKAREATYVVFYYLLGALRFSESDKQVLSIPTKANDDFELICEYINYHTNNLYYVTAAGNETYVSVGQPDLGISYDKHGTPCYSGAYVNKLVGLDISKFVLPIEKLNKSHIVTAQIQLDLADPTLEISEGIMIPVENGMSFSGPQRVIYSKEKFLVKDEDEVIEY